MLRKLSMLMCYVQDLPASVRFYKEVLGLTPEFESPGFAEFRTGSPDISVGLHPFSAGESVAAAAPRAGWVPIFEVADLTAARERLAQAGASHSPDFHDIPGGIVMDTQDPDGHPIELVQFTGQPH